MTHDELLIRLKEGQWVDKDEMHLRSNALRAIVELHKTYTPVFGGGTDYCWADDRPYPCDTIKAIDKELS